MAAESFAKYFGNEYSNRFIFTIFDAAPAFGEEADPHGFVALHCARSKAADLADWLLAQGAERVSVMALEQVFDAKNALYEALEARIGK